VQLITVAPNTERKATALLKALSLSHHAFKARRRVAHRGRLHETLTPVFPRYVFVEAQQRWEDVRALSCVGDFVRSNGQIAEVRPQVMDELRARADAADIITLPDPPSRFRHGDKVVVVAHNLVFGNRGTYWHGLEHDRACVLLPWFNGQMVPTAVDMADIDHLCLQQGNTRRRRKRRRGAGRPGVAA
jgi:hypothetical protein